MLLSAGSLGSVFLGNMHRQAALAIAAAVLLCGPVARAEEPLGMKPLYTARALTGIPNASALTRRLWLPGLNEGYVPQGIVFLDGKLFVSAYRSTDGKQNRGPCRLYAMNAETGAVLGHLDLPQSCGHAGGLAPGRSGRLLVTDARVLFEVELNEKTGSGIGRVVRTIALANGVKGSFAASAPDGFWIGAYERNEAGRIYRFPWSALQKRRLVRADAIEVVVAPVFSQGAAMDPEGALWVMRSGSKFGELVKLDRKNGSVLVRYAMPAGAGGVSLGTEGVVWGRLEAGWPGWSKWKGFYPLAFRFDPARLK